jgi:cation:H+ antiporter
MDFIIFIVSLAVLIWGSDLLINQSEKIALRFGISEYVIGATLVAVGTSLPEMAASITASINHKPEIAVANVIGSNIFNITLVLAAVFIVAKNVNPHRDFFAKDSSWALFPVLIFILMVLDGSFSRFDGVLLILLMFAYVLFLLRAGKDIILDEEEKEKGKGKDTPFNWSQVALLTLTGFVLVIVGADYTIESASAIAKSFGVSDWIIGIIMISLGTSMPELMVSITAALKGKADMAIGAIIGSNMANTTMVLGSAALVNQIHIDPMTYMFDISTMLVATLMLVFLSANKLYSKPAGISLLIVLALFLQNTIGSF